MRIQIHEDGARIFSALYPRRSKKRNIGPSEFNETHLLSRLKNFTVDLSTIDCAICHVQGKVIALAEAVARGEANQKTNRPYIPPNYLGRPRLPRPTAHVTAKTSRKPKSHRRGKQAISRQMLIRRHVRFIFLVDMCNAWAPFGVISDKVNRPAVLLSLAILANAGPAVRYRDLLVRTIADCARPRFPCDYHTALSDVHDDARLVISNDSDRRASPAECARKYAIGKTRPQNNGKGKGNGRAMRITKGKKRAPLPTPIRSIMRPVKGALRRRRLPLVIGDESNQERLGKLL